MIDFNLAKARLIFHLMKRVIFDAYQECVSAFVYKYDNLTLHRLNKILN